MIKLRDRLRCCFCKSMRESPIKYETLGFKDAELNSKFVRQKRQVVAERAKYYLIFLIASLLMTPIYIPMGWDSVIFAVATILTSILAVTICVLGARWRLWVTELICPLTVILRAVATYFCFKHSFDRLTCIPPLLTILFRYASLAYFFTDLILFKTNIYTTVLITLPVLMVTSAFLQ